MNKITKAVRLQLAKLLQLYQEIKIEDGRVFSVEGDIAIGEEIFVANEGGEFEPVPDGVYRTNDGLLITVASGRISVIEEAQTIADTTETEIELDDEPDPQEEIQALRDRVAALENENADLNRINSELQVKIAELEELRKKSAVNPIEGDEVHTEHKENMFMAYAHRHQ